MRIFLSLLIISIYWSMEAYIAVKDFSINFTDAFLLNYENSHMSIKISIAVIIFLLSLINIKEEEEKDENNSCNNEKLKALQDISDVILTPVPVHKQVDKIVEILETNLKINTAFIASYKEKDILLLNTNSSLEKIGIKEKYQPHKNILNDRTIDKLLSICLLEDKDSIDNIVEIDTFDYRVLVQTYRDEKSQKAMGVLVLVFDPSNTKEYSKFLNKIAEQIAFTVNLTKKKDDAMRSQAQYNAEFSALDPILNIPAISRVQRFIEHEIKRSQRYGTQLSLMIIEVDHMKNLSNIFKEKEAQNITKELTNVFRKNVRETDFFGKWSDNHFAIVSPDIEFRATKSFANKLNRLLEEHRFPKVGRITCSYGITSFSPKDTLGDFRKRAENALKEAVDRGGNAIEVKILV